MIVKTRPLFNLTFLVAVYVADLPQVHTPVWLLLNVTPLGYRRTTTKGAGQGTTSGLVFKVVRNEPSRQPLTHDQFFANSQQIRLSA
jgi:hypothetical protein